MVQKGQLFSSLWAWCRQRTDLRRRFDVKHGVTSSWLQLSGVPGPVVAKSLGLTPGGLVPAAFPRKFAANGSSVPVEISSPTSEESRTARTIRAIPGLGCVESSTTHLLVENTGTRCVFATHPTRHDPLASLARNATSVPSTCTTVSANPALSIARSLPPMAPGCGNHARPASRLGTGPYSLPLSFSTCSRSCVPWMNAKSQEEKGQKKEVPGTENDFLASMQQKSVPDTFSPSSLMTARCRPIKSC